MIDYLEMARLELVTRIKEHAHQTGCVDGDDCEQVSQYREALEHIEQAQFVQMSLALHRVHKPNDQ